MNFYVSNIFKLLNEAHRLIRKIWSKAKESVVVRHRDRISFLFQLERIILDLSVIEQFNINSVETPSSVLINSSNRCFDLFPSVSFRPANCITRKHLALFLIIVTVHHLHQESINPSKLISPSPIVVSSIMEIIHSSRHVTMRSVQTFRSSVRLCLISSLLVFLFQEIDIFHQEFTRSNSIAITFQSIFQINLLTVIAGMNASH